MKIKFDKLANYVREKEYSKISVPFVKGELFDEKLINISDDKGEEVLVQTEVLSKYDDNSIKWALVHFLPTLNANDKTFFDLEIGKKHNEVDMDLAEALNKLVPICLSLNINAVDYNIDIDFADLKDYQVIRKGPIITDILFKENIGIKEGSSLEVLFYVSLFKDKDYVKVDIKFTNKNINDLKISDTYILYKSFGKVTHKYIAHSNYRTTYVESDARTIYDKIDAGRIMSNSNEHYPETFYGAYYGVLREEDFGVCITIKEAFQNYPKALNVNDNCMSAYLIPENEVIKFYSGVSKTHTIYIQKFDNSLTKEDINRRHHQFQMPDLPILEEDVYKRVNFIENLFTEKKDYDIETFFINLADSKGCSYGMLNYGDVYDAGYTDQGRGGKHLVFSNNEYDYPYFANMIFLRTGIRRFFDYFSASARHMMDVDICHFSGDEYRQDGLVEHSRNHMSGKVSLSHEWLRGLIEYYHATGDIFAKEAFLKMGDNILRNLSRPMYSEGFEVNVRETGWALHALVGLYEETYDKKYLDACEKIKVHFIEWKEKYGALLAPYTDTTLIRVPFMISVACNSLYAYYKVTKDEKIKDLIISSVDDLLENALLDNGFFYYKELPSLQRIGNNGIILETLAICYSFTNDEKYLKAGIKTFKYLTNRSFPFGKKVFKDNVVLVEGQGTKTFAQSFYPLLKFYTFLIESNMEY